MTSEPSRHPTRLGIAGAGRAYERLYRPALRLIPELKLVSLAEPDLARSSRAARSLATARSLREMLGRGGLDAVAIVTPAELHAEQVNDTLAAGLPVLVEKPIALTLAEVESWRALDAERLLTPSFPRRYWGPYRRVLDRARGADRFEFYLRTDPTAWKAYARSPSDSATELLPHLADMARWFANAELRTIEARPIPGGVHAQFAAGDRRRLTCTATHGPAYLEWLRLDGATVAIGPGSRPRAAFNRLRRRPVDVAGFAAMLRDWALRLRGEPAPRLPTYDDAVANVRLIGEVEELVRTG